MRLFVNKKETPLLKRALASYIKRTTKDENAVRMQALLERVELCEKLQDSEKTAVKDELNSEYGFAEVLNDESY